MNTQQVTQEIGKDSLTKLLSFSDKLYTENRVVTSTQWSPNYLIHSQPHIPKMKKDQQQIK
ncbi:unnamed protein product [Paramecium octaurelia]|uniref:Uncharacterized protein n=1 Tax=Paramecium octaurelia TaxID=43137 RepID=A0A8S1TTP7_PAROT|nr:unnamed protein product [Paramecium octaurelia]